MTLTKRQKQYLLKDEREAVARYKRLGYPEFAADEHRHYLFIKRQRVKRKS